MSTIIRFGTILQVNTAGGGGDCVVPSSQILNPPTMTTDHDDLVVTGIETSCLIYFTSTDKIQIYGIDSSLITETRKYLFYNNNTNGKNIEFERHNNSGSAAQNRFEMNDDIKLKPGEWAWFIYSQARQRWNGQIKH